MNCKIYANHAHIFPDYLRAHGTVEKLLELMVRNPRRRFRVPLGNDFSVWDLEAEDRIEPEKFRSMGRATPFAGWKVFGKCMLTVKNGRIVDR